MSRYNLSHFQYAQIFNYCYWFLMLNLCFAVANLPFILALSFLKLIPSNILYFIVTLIPMGPALAALIASINKISVQRDISIAKDFWRFYKENFSGALFQWLITMALLFILVVDIMTFKGKPIFSIITPLFIILAILLVNMVITGLVLMAKMKYTFKNLLILSFYYSIKKFYISFLNMFLACFFIFILLIKPVFALTVLPSLIFFLIVRNSSWVFRMGL